MSEDDKKFLECAQSILRNARTMCASVLDLVDRNGEAPAFSYIIANSPQCNYTPELLKRMLKAAQGATEVELFSIAAEATRVMNDGEDDGEGWKRLDKPR